LQQQNSIEHDENINHRFTWNMEYKPDTINYLKVSPSFSYGSTNSSSFETDNYIINGVTNKAYTTRDVNNSTSPSFGITALYNHRFPNRRNLSIYLNASTAKTTSYDNPVNTYTTGVSNVPANQVINSNNNTTSFGGTLSYLEPLGIKSYLELNYTFNHSYTANDTETDTLSTTNTYNNYALLSNNYNYTFTTNKVGLNFRVIDTKYNYVLGLGVQPSTLDGQSITTGLHTHVNEFNIIPSARYVYNFSRNETFTANYSGISSQPSFNQLQPVTNFSNPLYLTQGNPDLAPQFTNSLSLRYNTFGITSGNIMFINASLSQIDNYVASDQITYAKFSKAALLADPTLSRYQNTILTKYLNTNGYRAASGQVVFSKPWDERKYTVIFSGAASYTEYPGFTSSVDSNNVSSPMLRNIAKSLVLTPGARFRLDILDVIDAQAIANYAISKTSNSLTGPLFSQNTNIRTLTLGLTGKNYFGNWTFSYDYNKQYNYGYASSVNITNPNILSLYLERRFLANNRATIRFATVDLFNENTGYTNTVSGNTNTQTNTNRLGRYYMLTFALRLQKFAGRAPNQNNGRGGRGGDRGGRGNGGFGGGKGGGGGGFGGGGNGIPPQ